VLEKTGTLTALIDEVSNYFLDHCPAGTHWEDFDPDMDELRESLQYLYDKEIALQSTPVRS
jgi:hypothetical protein